MYWFNLIVAKMEEIVYGRIENILEKGKNAGKLRQYILVFQEVFKTFFLKVSKRFEEPQKPQI